MTLPFPLLDPRERHHRIASPVSGLSLFLRHLPPTGRPNGRAVLYVHGASFPSALSIAHRFDGRSWRDDLADAGFDVWGFDFLGFGHSDRYPEMAAPAEAHAPLGRAGPAARQIEAAARFVAAHHAIARLSIVAHSWGTIAAGRCAQECPELVDRLVLFGPIVRREGEASDAPEPAWFPVTLDDQWTRFTKDVPAGEPAVLSGHHFADWGPRYLASDPGSADRRPAAVHVPGGPSADVIDAWSGRLAYDPAALALPVAIIRGEWDSSSTDADARWLFDRLVASPVKRDVKIGRATHLMHLETGRTALHAETRAFLLGE
ncbi:MAG TPA: alpha/beta hydrolase [Aliidongia sp.]|uniref:alpha/beta hydrolase n=1 Tax=Aliidongia sp. TaxID=1914230 RepID=UPI002DDDBC07|nr:alpha/beta hydrolase [Aliidongia sp.]HEV2677286.1 alpha/beta hydrolase [Aliidongia sp.]